MENLIATATPAGVCHYTLDVCVPAAAVDAAFKKARRKFSQEVRLPGFRPGKAPEAMIRQRFAEPILDEVKKALFRDALRAAIEEKKLAPVTLPTLVPDKEGTVAEGREFAFAVEFDVEPPFDLPSYTGLALTRHLVPVTEDDVTRAIDELRRQRATFGVVDAPANAGDLIKAACHADTSGLPEAPASVQRLLHADETWLLLNPPEMLPGATAALTGATAGTERTFPVQFPAEYFESFLAGKQLTYTVKVIEVQARQLPELTDAFAVGAGFANLAELRAAIQKRLTDRITELQTDHLRQQAIQQLLERGEFALPPKQLEMEIRIARTELERQRQDRGPAAGTPEPPTAEAEAELAQQATRQATGRLRLRYLVERIAKQEAITIESDEIQQQMETFRQYQRLTPAEFSKRYDAMRVAEALYLDLLRERVLEKIVAQAHITDQPVTPPATPDAPAAPAAPDPAAAPSA